jgi:hypothetical protein
MMDMEIGVAELQAMACYGLPGTPEGNRKAATDCSLELWEIICLTP